jgi:hypothetical protein
MRRSQSQTLTRGRARRRRCRCCCATNTLRSLAFLAYKRANGECDDDIIRVTTEHGLYKDQARYLVERQDLDLWARVLTPPDMVEGKKEPASRRALIEQVSF